ncbi:hypothetical protein PybrP1_009667 [[Pythium] brassicae (nom. inval.)]|nr:hypothetical protein PybrP1_009667 [[Pythium] brassicae (nom. inval.)]
MDDVVMVMPPPVSTTPAMPASSNSGGGSDATRTVLIIAQEGSRVDYVKFRSVCWFFDHEHALQHSARHSVSAQYTALKLAPPDGPQFQLRLYSMKKYQCHCRRCGHQFHQMVQKGVDNGIATKILSLAYENICDRFILFAGDGDFYDSLNHIKNVLRKDLWVIVSADLQQLASHMLWVNDLWSQIKMPSEPGAAAAPNTSDVEEREASEDEHASRRPPKKRGRDRQVQMLCTNKAWAGLKDHLGAREATPATLRTKTAMKTQPSTPRLAQHRKSDEGRKDAAVSAPLSFALSDISTSGDEDERLVMPSAAKLAKITVIDLASDSETE